MRYRHTSALAVLALGYLQLATSAPFYTIQLVLDMNPDKENFAKHHYYCATNLPLNTSKNVNRYIASVLEIAHTTEDELKNRLATTTQPRVLILGMLGPSGAVDPDYSVSTCWKTYVTLHFLKM